jgi:H/ACA ribonucleoprotein complex subunit 4
MNKLPFEQKKPKVIIKKKNFKIKSHKYTLEELFNKGIIILNKPSGPNSASCGNKIKAALEQPKGGHAGTLDPKVTGVLPIGLGKATKILPVLSDAGKVYRGTLKIHQELPKKKIEDGFKKMTGDIEQLPPKISAVARRLRTRTVYWAKVLKIDHKLVDFEIGCQAGTYIRKWAHDLGELLGTGAHMTSLQRIQSGPYKLKDTVELEQITKNYSQYMKTKKPKLIQDVIKPVESAVAGLPKVWIDDLTLEAFKHGSPIYIPGIIQFTSDVEKDKIVAVFNLNDQLIGLGVAQMDSKAIEHEQKGTAIKTDVVIV